MAGVSLDVIRKAIEEVYKDNEWAIKDYGNGMYSCGGLYFGEGGKKLLEDEIKKEVQLRSQQDNDVHTGSVEQGNGESNQGTSRVSGS